MNGARPGLVFATFGAALASCSALGLGEHDLMPCDVSDPEACKELNEALPVEQCDRYYCQAGGGCKLETRVADETCDGLDNDCDLIIDEGADIVQSAREWGPIHEGVRRVSSAASQTGAVQIALTHESRDDNSFATTLLAVLDGEVRQDETIAFSACMGARAEQECNIDDLAIASTSQLLVGAGFQRAPCKPGQLRIGVGSLAPFELALGEPAIAARTAMTVDVDGTEQRCTVSAGCRGADAPVIALLPDLGGAFTDAFVVWRAVAAREGGECDASSGQHRIAAIGFAIDERDSMARLVAPRASRSALLSELDATGEPAIAPLEHDRPKGRGFLVAFPSGDRIELRLIAAPGSPSEIDAAAQASVEAPGAQALALAGGLSGGRGLAIAYRAEVEGKPVLQMRRLSVGAGPEPELTAMGAAITVEPQASVIGAPTLSYAPDGFAIPGEGRPAGGWIMTWVERSMADAATVERLMLSRIAEARLDEPSAAVELAAEASTPFTYLKQQGDEPSSLHAAYLVGDMIRFRSVTCPM